MNDVSSNQIIQNIKKVTDKYYEILLYLLQSKTSILPHSFIDTDKLNTIFVESYKQLIEKPNKFLQLNSEYFQKLQQLFISSLSKYPSSQDSSRNTTKNKRFKDQAWHNSVYFNFIKDFYSISSEFAARYVNECNFDKETKNYADFQLNQFLSALSPVNFIHSNPEVLKKTIETNWQNIVQGLDNFLSDLKKSGNIFTIPNTNNSSFKKGENIAATPGKIIYQNKLMQLIAYEPKDVSHSIPLFIIPPWINKYYILDLSPHNSLVKFLTENNFQVFMVSWVNPDKSYADTDFEDYLRYGILEPCDYLETLGIKTINALGYCIGGTLLSCALAYLEAKNINYINCASFFTTLLDFAQPGEIGTFINGTTISVIENEMQATGYLDGRYLSNSFSLLRANDLIWSFFVNNYLLGKTPPAFDFLYWNADSTNLPAKMHSYYLRNMYLNNLLKEAGRLKMLDTAIDLSVIKIPSFFAAASQDHIAPWQSVYNSATLLNGSKTFCLTESGHVAGIINSPANNKYSYKNNDKFTISADEWLASCQKHEGSWWPYWQEWLKSHSGSTVRSTYYNKLDMIEKAPGSYCRMEFK